MKAHRQVTVFAAAVALTAVIGSGAQHIDRFAAADKRPGGFMGVRWRSTQADAIKALQISEADCSDLGGYHWCTAGLRLGEAQAKAHFYFENGHFGEVLINFSSDDFDFVKAVFLQRYGPPSSVTFVPMWNAFGVRFDSERLLWVWSGVSATLQQHSTSIDEGDASIDTSWMQAAEAKRDAAEKKRAAAALDQLPSPPSDEQPRPTTPRPSPWLDLNLLKDLGLSPGMKDEEIIAKIGSPNDIRQSRIGDQAVEEWVYEKAGYTLYLAKPSLTLYATSKQR